jgi:hypothetical protein
MSWNLLVYGISFDGFPKGRNYKMNWQDLIPSPRG